MFIIKNYICVFPRARYKKNWERYVHGQMH